MENPRKRANARVAYTKKPIAPIRKVSMKKSRIVPKSALKTVQVEVSKNLINEALSVLDTEIKNGREAVDTIKKIPRISVNVRRGILKNEEAAQNAIRLRGKISRLKLALENGDQKQILHELCGNLFKQLESLSKELVLHLAEIIFIVYLDNIEESYRRAEEDISDLLKLENEKTSKGFLNILVDQNQMITDKVIKASDIVSKTYDASRNKLRIFNKSARNHLSFSPKTREIHRKQRISRLLHTVPHIDFLQKLTNEQLEEYSLNDPTELQEEETSQYLTQSPYRLLQGAHDHQHQDISGRHEQTESRNPEMPPILNDARLRLQFLLTQLHEESQLSDVSADFLETSPLPIQNTILHGQILQDESPTQETLQRFLENQLINDLIHFEDDLPNIHHLGTPTNKNDNLPHDKRKQFLMQHLANESQINDFEISLDDEVPEQNSVESTNFPVNFLQGQHELELEDLRIDPLANSSLISPSDKIQNLLTHIQEESQLLDISSDLVDEIPTQLQKSSISPSRILQGRHKPSKVSPKSQIIKLLHQLKDEQQLDDLEISLENFEDVRDSSSVSPNMAVSFLQGQHEPENQLADFSADIIEEVEEIQTPNTSPGRILEGRHASSHITSAQQVFYQLTDEQLIGDISVNFVDSSQSSSDTQTISNQSARTAIANMLQGRHQLDKKDRRIETLLQQLTNESQIDDFEISLDDELSDQMPFETTDLPVNFLQGQHEPLLEKLLSQMRNEIQLADLSSSLDDYSDIQSPEISTPIGRILQGRHISPEITSVQQVLHPFPDEQLEDVSEKFSQSSSSYESSQDDSQMSFANQSAFEDVAKILHGRHNNDRRNESLIPHLADETQINDFEISLDADQETETLANYLQGHHELNSSDLRVDHLPEISSVLSLRNKIQNLLAQMHEEHQLSDFSADLVDESFQSLENSFPGHILQGQHPVPDRISPKSQILNLIQQLKDEQHLDDLEMSLENFEDEGVSPNMPVNFLQGQHLSATTISTRQKLDELFRQLSQEDKIEDFEINLHESFSDSPSREFSGDLLRGQHQSCMKTPIRKALRHPRRQLADVLLQIADDSQLDDLSNTEMSFARSPNISAHHFSAARGNLGQLINELAQDSDENLLDVALDLVQSPPKSPIEPATIFGEIQNAMQEIKRKAGTLSMQNSLDIDSQQLLMTLAQLKSILNKI